MIIRIFSFLNRPTSRNVFINTVGNYLNVFFTAFFALILVRLMAPSQYGVLSVLLGIAYVLANLLDFGTTASIYSFLPPLIKEKRENSYPFIKTTITFQTLFSMIIIFILIISFPTLDKYFFKTQAPYWELVITAIMVLFLIWQNTITNMFFATKNFLSANIYLLIANIVKTIVIVGLAYAEKISVGVILIIYGILGPLIFFIIIFLRKKLIIVSLVKAPIQLKEFRFRYTLTYFMASQFYFLGMRMDLFLMSYFRSKTEVGYYGLAQKIILTILTTLTSITQVLSPQFSHIIDKKSAKHLFKTAFIYLLIPCGLLALLLIIPDQVFTFLFTKNYLPAFTIARYLSIPFIIAILLNLPILFILYTIKKPVVILIANIAFFLTITVGCYWLIPISGINAPPIVITLSFVFASIILIYSMLNYYQRLSNQHSKV